VSTLTPIPASDNAQPLPPAPRPPTPVTAKGRKRPRSLFDRVEAYVSVLSTKNNFWHRVCSLIWLPFAFRSGIKMKRLGDNTFSAILPFRRFNRNWYNAMAGAALLGNAEIAGGMYVFGVCGGDYTVVCKHLEYKFLRPCFGPAVYRITPREDIKAHLAHGGEFNIVIDMDVCQAVNKPAIAGGPDKEKRVGRCVVTFHVTPKAHHKNKAERAKADAEADAAQEPAADQPGAAR
jgi:acyl-coenzyme A thioesterase PaaI-like protein